MPGAPTVSRQGRGSWTVHGPAIGGGLCRHLRLFALVVDFGEQPELIPVAAWVLHQLEEMTAAQPWLVAFAFGQLEVVTVAFQGALRQVFATAAVGEAAGVVVVFEVRSELTGK